MIFGVLNNNHIFNKTLIKKGSLLYMKNNSWYTLKNNIKIGNNIKIIGVNISSEQNSKNTKKETI